MSLSPEEREILRETLNKTLYGYELTEAIWIAAKNWAYEQAAKACRTRAQELRGMHLPATVGQACADAILSLKDKHG